MSQCAGMNNSSLRHMTVKKVAIVELTFFSIEDKVSLIFGEVT